MKRLLRGEPASIPVHVAAHIIAATYGAGSAQAVLDWPADEFKLAVRLLEVTSRGR